MSTNTTRMQIARRFLPVAAAASALVIALTSTAQANPRILVDVRTGQVLDHEDAFRKWYPASLTKMMTAYTVFRALRAGELTLDSPVTMTKRAASQPASKMYYKPGQQMTLDSALKMLLVKSANDVAVAIAESVGGSQEAFVARMNAEARRIGMTSSHFINPNGLPGKGQYTTARDLAVLAVTLRREFPEYAGYFSLEGFTTGKKKYPNYNLLIGRFDGADGMKTGFICASGFNQVSSATRNGRTVVSVVLGTESLGARADASADMLQAGLTARSGSGQSLATLRPYGDVSTVADISAEICSAKGKKVRSEGRDEVGRMKIRSPNMHELTREPNYVFAGLIAGSQAIAGKAAAAGGGEIANVPVPTPRPTF
ncbi:D-alanyl-D-alanine carboxypeptidase [Rhizobiaceae bacterium n13]|uniref:D-alanyl-D-alanine carboxypeptidase n=1 Tax=Ferirhizobium litorale TaxID=2927786 RepID=A0AAE3U3A7_9HYPH|nr:D-alanyl-D-alanine carboxypeptidase family protein [Fererhizobium litorale]MDI7862574.1 D-alanyl-D-alanine carboxypeptidase [Fererhizobium litorale]MDI7923592.1 D-alanyl-D-alanine carboxypeptidase [Fererhizobium litorale]